MQQPAAPAPLSQELVDLDPAFQRVLAKIGYEITALDVIIARVLIDGGPSFLHAVTIRMKGLCALARDDNLKSGAYV